jgi:trans-aconitate methyltransferase
VGCGAGTLTAALVDTGFEVTRIDSSAELLPVLRTAIPKAHFTHGSFYETRIPVCEAMVALGGPLTYHAEDADDDGV